MRAERYPLDFEALEKGSVVTADVLERISGAQRGTAVYGLKALALCKSIEEFFSGRSLIVTVAMVKGELRVLTDAEAVEYNARSFASGLDRMARAHRRTLGVDRSLLSTEEQSSHERMVVVNGKTLQAAISGRKEAIKELPHTRTVPRFDG